MRYSLPNQSLISVVGFGVLAVGSSLLLMPRGREMALLQFRSGDQQLGLAMLEERLTIDRSPSTIAALAAARADSGNVVGAAELLEEMAARGAAGLDALAMLEGYERTTGRNAQLVHTLDQLQILAPTLQRQREIVSLYGAAGLAEDRLRASRDLVRNFAAEPVEFVLLAQLEQASGHTLEAELALQALAARHPEAVDASMVGLEVGILLSSSQPQLAFARARDWMQGRDDLAVAAPLLAGSFSMGKRPDLAVALLQPIATLTPRPEIVAALAQAESDDGHPGDGLRWLERLNPNDETAVGGAAALLRVRLALAVQDVDRAMAAIDRVGIAVTPDDILLPFAELALANQRIDVLRTLVAETHPTTLQADPVLAARVMLALGDKAAAQRWSSLAMATIEGRPVRAIQLAEVELALGRRDGAAALLDRAVADPSLPPAALRPAAGLYLSAGRAEQGRRQFQGLREARPGAAADIAWALTAAASGHGREVIVLLSRADRSVISADALQDLFYVAGDAHDPDLALAAARQLVAMRGGPADALLLARALLGAGQPVPALAQLRAISNPGIVPEDFKAAVLLAAWRQKAPVAPELQTIWVGRLAAAKTVQERNAAISLLLELRAYAQLLPLLRPLAEQDPEHWLWSFGEAAKATGHKADLVSLWARLSTRPDLPALLRRQLAFNLLQNGNKAAAESGFRMLASSAAPTSPDLRELLFLWGPRPAAAQLDWIETRARQAGSGDKAAWMSILATHGAAGRAIEVYHANAGEPSPAMKEAYLAALSATGNRTKLASEIRSELPLTSSMAGLQQLAQLSERAGDPALEQLVLNKLVTTCGGIPSAVRRLGVLAYQAHDLATAERLLRQFTSMAGGDFETRMLLGDLSARRRDGSGARQHYAASLSLVQAAHDNSARANAVRANLLHRLGRDEEAVQLYETLLAASPHDNNLRADYVAMLMERGSLRKAQAVLANR